MANDLIDPYMQPGRDVLKNKLNVTNAEALSKFEYKASAFRAKELQANPIQGNFDLDHLKAVHKKLFGDVYEWAGELRTVNISKGGTSFTRNSQIEGYADKIHNDLLKDNLLKGLEKPQFVERLSHYYAELNTLHPFREGNGRATREFIGQLAKQAGYELDQTRIDNEKGRWNEAARRSFSGDLEGVKQIFSEAVRPSRAVAFEHLTEQEALKKHPELKPAYAGLQKVSESLNERFPGNEKAQQHYMLQARSEVIRKLDTGKVLEPIKTQEPVKRQEIRQEPVRSGMSR